MKVTAARCRTGASIIHNTREFDLSKADHIDEKRQDLNYHLRSKDEEFFHFKEHYGKQIEELNERAIEARHPERVKTLEHAFFDKKSKYKPEEIVLQIGNKNETVPDPIFRQAVHQFIDKLKEQYPQLDISNVHYHLDEATPHCHLDFYLPYKDENGNFLLGNKTLALTQMGVERPDPDKEISRYNCPLMSFSQQIRELFGEICQSKHLNIDMTPSERSKEHLSKEHYILSQEVQNLKHELIDLEIKKNQQIQNFKEEAASLLSRANNLEKQLLDEKGFIERFMEKNDTDEAFRQSRYTAFQNGRELFRDDLRVQGKKLFREVTIPELAQERQKVVQQVHHMHM